MITRRVCIAWLAATNTGSRLTHALKGKGSTVYGLMIALGKP